MGKIITEAWSALFDIRIQAIWNLQQCSEKKESLQLHWGPQGAPGAAILISKETRGYATLSLSSPPSSGDWSVGSLIGLQVPQSNLGQHIWKREIFIPCGEQKQKQKTKKPDYNYLITTWGLGGWKTKLSGVTNSSQFAWDWSHFKMEKVLCSRTPSVLGKVDGWLPRRLENVGSYVQWAKTFSMLMSGHKSHKC